MRDFRYSKNVDSHRIDRSGFLFLGALREILVVALFAALVLGVIFQVNTVLRSQVSSLARNTLSGRSEPVFGLDYDRDRQTLLVQSWPPAFEVISLSNISVSKKEVPPDFVMAQSSESNSTTIMLSESSTKDGLYHGVHILRQDQSLLFEEFLDESQHPAVVWISSDGSIAMLVFQEGFVVGWDLVSTVPARFQYDIGQSVFTSRLSPDGRSLLVIANEGDSRICDALTGERRVLLPKIERCTRCVAWSRDHQRLAVGGHNGMTYVFDAETGKTLWQMKSDFLFARALALSSDGNRLIVAGFDRTIRIWDWSCETGEPQVLSGSTSLIRDFVLTDSERKLVVGCDDGTIREWSLVTHSLIRQLR